MYGRGPGLFYERSTGLTSGTRTSTRTVLCTLYSYEYGSFSSRTAGTACTPAVLGGGLVLIVNLTLVCRGGQQHLPGSIGYLQTVMNRLNEYANWLGSSV